MFSFEQKVEDGGKSGLSCPSMKELMIIGLIQTVFYFFSSCTGVAEVRAQLDSCLSIGLRQKKEMQKPEIVPYSSGCLFLVTLALVL